MAQWKAHHRRICKAYNRYNISSEYQALSVNEKVDAVLLSQVLIQLYPNDQFDLTPSTDGDPLAATFSDLLESSAQVDPPPLCRTSKSAAVPRDTIRKIFSRFGNNNFILHSHLNTYAHGVYPMASRFFNHSCTPNCVAKYIIAPQQVVKMELVALHNIAAGDELTIPYLDPALPYETRQDALQSNYGFQCACQLCIFQGRIQPIPPLPSTLPETSHLWDRLRAFVDSMGDSQDNPLVFAISEELYPFLNDTCLPDLSEQFTRSSHEGEFDIAILTGKRLLALYRMIYPRNFPQIGMHALELAKTAWNAVVTMEHKADLSVVQSFADEARASVLIASRVLNNFGIEGDEGGPLEEIRILQGLLSEERALP
ncbi:hypothetical protein QCA50_006684 [Cerrena zonata]|uniref:SET domain-containing protein n=1 Tax=Cerrena zonata TaxID=2478898 RepID=A0AAW0GK67_9APHY